MKLGPLEIHWHRGDAAALTREHIRSAVRNELAARKATSDAAREERRARRARIHVIQRNARDAARPVAAYDNHVMGAEIVIVIEPDGSAWLKKQRNDDYEVTYEKQ